MLGTAPSLAKQVVDVACEESGIVQDETLEGLYGKARSGNPFPLIAHQWPDLIVTDPDEQKFFQGTPGDPDDPCLRLDDWQREFIIKPFFDQAIYEIAIKGNTKPGKGASVSICVNLWFEIHNHAKIILTSTTHQHAKNVIFAEVVKWRKQMVSPRPSRILIKSIGDSEQHYVEISNPKTGEGFSGQHGPATLFVFDEATGIPDRFYEDAGKQARKIVAIGNPRTLSGWFFKLFQNCEGGKSGRNVTQVIPAPMGLRQCVTVGGHDCMNVRHKRLEVPIGPPGGITIKGRFFEEASRIPDAYYRHVRPLIPNQVDLSRYLAITSHADPRHVAVFAHGHFPDEDPEKQVILSSWLDRHVQAFNERWQEIKVCTFGFDVARSLDGDKSVLTYGGEEGILGQESWQYNDVVKTAKYLVEWTLKHLSIDLTKGRHPVVVDMVGLGAGVGDTLRQLTIKNGRVVMIEEMDDDDGIDRPGVWVIEFRGNDRSEVDPKTYANLRAESYATLGRRLNPDDRWRLQEFMIPDDGELHEELCAPEKVYQAGGDKIRFKLCPKEDITSSLGRSPDKGDSAVYFFHGLRQYLDINDQFKTWEKTAIVKEPTSQEREEMRGKILSEEDYVAVDEIGKKKVDWGKGLTFERAGSDDED